MSEDTVSPTRGFTGSPADVIGPFQLGLLFNEPVTGVGLEDFRVENGVVETISGGGESYLLTIRPYRFGDVRIVSLPGGVKDAAGNEPTGERSRTISTYSWWYLSVDAFGRLSNPGFSHGFDNRPDGSVESYYQVTDGSRSGAIHFDPQIKVNYQFKVTRSGDYRVRGLLRADDNLSASFYIGMNAQADPLVWNANRGLGEIGSGQWHWSNAGTYEGDHVFHLQAGANTVEIYGRDDGTKLGHLELVPLRPFPMWGDVPLVSSAFPIMVPLTFTDEVSGLEASDFVASGGRVTAVTGSGREYLVAVVPSERDVTVSLPENMVTGLGGEGNSTSALWTFVYRGPYQQWALAQGLDDSGAALLSDADHDDVGQLLEYAFGLNPLVSDHGGSGPASPFGLPKMTRVTGGGVEKLVLHYVRRKGVPGLVYQPQFSDSLAGWADSEASPVVEDIDGTWEKVSVVDEAATGTEGRRFGRVNVGFPSN